MAQAKQIGAYPLDWPRLAALVKQEAGGACVRCRRPHDVASGYCLTVHHFTGDKDCNERWNLMALCQRCHLSIQARVNPDVPLLMLPSPWIMPYLVGYYESGRGIPGPLYDPARWREIYETQVGAWPSWASAPDAAAGKG